MIDPFTVLGGVSAAASLAEKLLKNADKSFLMSIRRTHENDLREAGLLRVGHRSRRKIEGFPVCMRVTLAHLRITVG